MNGLKMIRIRCNFSVDEIADALDVSVAELAAWENDKIPIPGNARIQLADFFGIEKEYLGEITEEQKRDLLEIAMFRHQDGGKFYYNYKPSENNVGIFFPGDREITLDEEHVCVKNKMQEVLDDVSGIIAYYETRTDNLNDKVQNMNRRCRVYEKFNKIMSEIPEKKSEFRVPYFKQIEGVLQAILIAHGMISEEDLQNDDSSCNDDHEFIIQLAGMIKSDWNKSELAVNAFTEECRNDEKQQNQVYSEQPMTLNEKIAYAKRKRIEFMEESGFDYTDSFGIPRL